MRFGGLPVSCFCFSGVWAKSVASVSLYSTLLYFTLLYSTLLYSTLLCSTLLYSTLLDFTLLYFTLLYFTLDVVGGTPGGRALHGLFSKVACDMPPTGGLLGGYQGIAGDYAGIFPGDPSNNLGGLLDCHFIGLIILHMLSSKCMFVFFRIRPLEELLH